MFFRTLVSRVPYIKTRAAEVARFFRNVQKDIHSSPAGDGRDIVMRALLLCFLKDQSGATAIEYGLIAAGISLAIIAVVNGLGTGLNAKFKSISTQLK